MRKRLTIILLLMTVAIIGAFHVAYADVYQDWYFYTDDGNRREVLFYEPESQSYYNKYDESGSMFEYDHVRTIYVSGTTVRDVVSTNEKVAQVYKEECIGGTTIRVYRQGGGECKIRIRGAARDANGNYWQECPVLANPTPFKLTKSSYVFKKASQGTYLAIGNDYRGADSYITKARSSNSRIVKVKTSKYGSTGYALIYPVRPGKAKVTVYDKKGNSKTITITVKKTYFKSVFKQLKKSNHIVEGNGRHIFFWALPAGTKVTVKVYGRTYRSTVKPTNEDVPSKIKIRKKLKKGTKIKNNFRSNGYKLTRTLKFDTNDFVFR